MTKNEKINWDTVEISEFFEGVKRRMLAGEAISPEETERMRSDLDRLDRHINECERLKMELGRVYDYSQLNSCGYSSDQIAEFDREDEEYVKKIDEFYLKNLQRRDYMFGYPANMEDYSYSTQYLRHLESKMYLMNNCGDPYQRGNYRMDSKSIEKKIISLVAENFGIGSDSYWGYITSGGTESNFWGIREGFNRFPKGRLYFSDDTHYSVEKYVFDGENSSRYPYKKIKSDEYGRICPEALFAEVEKDKELGYEGVILVLTWGTTCRGAVDDVKGITSELDKRNIPYYCHLDAALYGGIGQNQENAPCVENLSMLGVDSVAVSMHKFMGTARVNGVLLALNRKNRQIIDYIGQEDSTLLGSRDYLPFSTYQRAREVLLRRPSDHYSRNVDYFEGELQRLGVAYERFENSNIFVISKPDDDICRKYQLADFIDASGAEKAHIIIFPFHKKQIIDELIVDLTK